MSKRKKIKITLESVDEHLKEKLKDPKFAKIYYAYKAKLKAEMRLEEIKEFLNECGYIGYHGRDRRQYFEFNNLAQIINKFFVHKDNLPSVDGMIETIWNNLIKIPSRREKAKLNKVMQINIKRVAKAIRKLIEGKK